MTLLSYPPVIISKLLFQYAMIIK